MVPARVWGIQSAAIAKYPITLSRICIDARNSMLMWSYLAIYVPRSHIAGMALQSEKQRRMLIFNGYSASWKRRLGYDLGTRTLVS
jgi:hypothetical protein